MAITDAPVREDLGLVATQRRSMMRTAAWIITLVAGVALIATGPVMVVVGLDGKSQVASQLKQEQIITPPDATIPNAAVVDARTAQAQADVIWKHMMEASGGKTYAQISKDAPADLLKVRATLATGDSLRASLLSAVLAWNIANLVIGLGAVFFGLGVVFLVVGLALRRTRAPTS